MDKEHKTEVEKVVEVIKCFISTYMDTFIEHIQRIPTEIIKKLRKIGRIF